MYYSINYCIGISALVGILTAIDSIDYALNDNFSIMGANTFTIQDAGEEHALVTTD